MDLRVVKSGSRNHVTGVRKVSWKSDGREGNFILKLDMEQDFQRNFYSLQV